MRQTKHILPIKAKIKQIDFAVDVAFSFQLKEDKKETVHCI
jgi:hypothetical protein